MLSSEQQSRPNRTVKFATWIAVILVLIVISSKFAAGPFKQGKVLGINLVSSFNFIFEQEISPLQTIVEPALIEKDGEYAVYVEDLTDGEKYGFNESESFPSASLYKVFLIAAVLKEVESGRLNEESVISAKKSHLEDIFGGVDFGYEDSAEEIEYTVDQALTRVGRISDNFAAIMLAEKIGWGKVQAMADSVGTTQTIIKSPISTSASDMGLFFKKLHARQIISVYGSEKIEKYLLLNQINNRIPEKLPEKTKVVHKTGELRGVRNDAGIVYLEGRPYVIVLMSNDLKYEDTGSETLAELSLKIFEYFAKKESSNNTPLPRR